MQIELTQGNSEHTLIFQSYINHIQDTSERWGFGRWGPLFGHWGFLDVGGLVVDWHFWTFFFWLFGVQPPMFKRILYRVSAHLHLK